MEWKTSDGIIIPSLIPKNSAKQNMEKGMEVDA
jgi:hypothetical protein